MGKRASAESDLNIVYKTHLFNNSVNPIEKSEILRQLNVLNHQIESKLITAHDYINVIKSNANITQTEILKIIEDLKRSGGNNFIDPDIFNKFIDNLNSYLSTLDLEQIVAFTNIIGIFTILITLISIIFIFYGNLLLDYFNLEDRYPKIAKIIILRRKLQQYYLLWNIFVITVVLISMFFVNLLILI